MLLQNTLSPLPKRKHKIDKLKIRKSVKLEKLSSVYLCKETPSPFSYISYLPTLLPHSHRTPYFWAPNMWRFFPHQKAVRNPNGGWAVVLSIAPSNAWNTSWESYNLTQFNSILTPSTLRQHQISQVKVSVLQDRPLHFRCHSQAQVLTCASDLPATKAESQSQVQVVTFTSDHLAMNQQFPQTPPWVQLIY